MMDRYGSEKNYNKQLINAFKHGDSPEIIIVVDKLLTGFDAPCNTVLYLARNLWMICFCGLLTSWTFLSFRPSSMVGF